jgi:hypothetical protein
MKLKRLILSAVVAVGLLVGIGVSPASAHNFDNNSAWACGATRPNSSYTLTHSHPVYLTEAYVTESCIGDNDSFVCTWTAMLWWNGAVSGPYNMHCAPI